LVEQLPSEDLLGFGVGFALSEFPIAARETFRTQPGGDATQFVLTETGNLLQTWSATARKSNRRASNRFSEPRFRIGGLG